MIVNAVNVTEGKHYMLRVKGVENLKKVEYVIYHNATVFGDVVSVYEYPGENEVRVLMDAGTASGTGFARIITKLTDLEGVR